MNIIVPLMGTGERFRAAGYAMPKPMISVNGKPMIERAIEPFLDRGEFTFVVRPEYEGLKLPGYKLVLEQNTQGAACTVLEGLRHLNYNEPLIILNSDQILNFSWLNFDTLVNETNPDGVIWVFKADEDRWSYAKVHDGRIVSVAEKQKISEWATCGAYYFREAFLFRMAAEYMLSQRATVNNEYYVAPSYNWMSEDSKILPFESVMHGLGTPEDLEKYLCTLA